MPHPNKPQSRSKLIPKSQSQPQTQQQPRGHFLRSDSLDEARGFAPSPSPPTRHSQPDLEPDPDPDSDPDSDPEPDSSEYDSSNADIDAADADVKANAELADLQLRLANTETALADCRESLAAKKEHNNAPRQDPENHGPVRQPQRRRPSREDNPVIRRTHTNQTFSFSIEDWRNFDRIPPSDHVSLRTQSEPTMPPVPYLPRFPHRRRSSQPERLPVRDKELEVIVPRAGLISRIQRYIQNLGHQISIYYYSTQTFIQAIVSSIPGTLTHIQRPAVQYIQTQYRRIHYPLRLIIHLLRYIFIHLTAEILRILIHLFSFLIPYAVLTYGLVALMYFGLYALRESSTTSSIFGLAAFPIFTPCAFFLCMVPGVYEVDVYSICPPRDNTGGSYFFKANPQNSHSSNSVSSGSDSGSKPPPEPSPAEAALLTQFSTLISPTFWDSSLTHAKSLESLGHDLRLAREPYESLYHSWKWTLDLFLQQRRGHVLDPLMKVAVCLEEEAETLIFFHGKVVSAYLNVEVTLGYFGDKLDALAKRPVSSGILGGIGIGGASSLARDSARLKSNYIHFATSIIAEIDELITHINTILELTSRTDSSLVSLRKALFELELARLVDWDNQYWWVKFWWGRKGSVWRREGREVSGIVVGHGDMIKQLEEVRSMLKDRRIGW
ncbi:uncharacterized protein RAG0_02761 [Rhynchosporium agropyri]|uniref:Uncharacterized protein n=1 Tax=Rhynchosporium agropyri TaxID=914238 RepID=A0A1E1K2K4_9HELO|nr:uncharacterized protein RAG0_02761 [Rhynchosporium agropyri]